MKVLMINVVCGIRSTGRICTDLANALEKEGHEVKIAYGRESVPSKYQKYAVRVGRPIDTSLHGVKARLLDGAGLGSKAATKRFISWVKEYDPDVIHLHNIHGYYINVEVLFEYLRNSGKKIIWTLHDCWSFTGHCAFFDYAGCEKWKKGCEHCPQKKDYPTRIGPDFSKRNYSLKKKLFTGIQNLTLVTPSKWLADLLPLSFMKDYPVEVIRNGVDTSVFKPTKSDIKEKLHCKDKKIILGVAAIWDKRKGLESFLELSKKLDSTYQIILIGLNQKQIEKLPKNIIGLERTDSVQELAKLYSAADVFVNPTLEDTYPTTNIESLACGTPVISYQTGGSGESANVSVPKNDIDGLFKAIKNIKTAKAKDIDADYRTSLRQYLALYEK